MSPQLPAITVEQLLALNDEIRALARAGVPFERGLRALGGDLPGRLGRLARTLSERMERGESLVDVLQSSQESLPVVYRAVVVAGLRSGHSPQALESLARSLRQASELRQTLIVAMAYPLLLAAIATVVFLFSVFQTTPVIRDLFGLVEIAPPRWYEWLTIATNQAIYLLPWVWGAVVIGIVIWWFRSRRAVRWGSWGGGLWPTIGGVRQAGSMAAFSELLATLVDHQIPMVEAVELAAAASGGRELKHAGKLLANSLRRGGLDAPLPRSFPPLLAWLVMTSPNQPQLARALRRNAQVFRRRAIRMSIVLGTYFPIFLSAALGGAIALYYVMLTMAPFYYLLFQLGQP